jgi:hypothetical protein
MKCTIFWVISAVYQRKKVPSGFGCLDSIPGTSLRQLRLSPPPPPQSLSLLILLFTFVFHWIALSQIEGISEQEAAGEENQLSNASTNDRYRTSRLCTVHPFYGGFCRCRRILYKKCTEYTLERFGGIKFHSITFIPYIHPSSFAEVPLHLLNARQLSGKNLPKCQAENRTRACLSITRHTTKYQLSYAAPLHSFKYSNCKQYKVHPQNPAHPSGSIMTMYII